MLHPALLSRAYTAPASARDAPQEAALSGVRGPWSLCRYATMKFPSNFAKKVDMRRVHTEVMRPWVAKKVLQYVGMEDDIVVNMVMAELEGQGENPDPRKIQVGGA